MAVERSEKYFKTEYASHLGSKSSKHYMSVKKHSCNGPGGASMPCAKGSVE